MNKLNTRVLALATILISTNALAASYDNRGDGHGSQHNAHGAHGPQKHSESAAGHPGSQATVDRTIAVGAADNMRFSADRWRIQPGETIRFVVTNHGQLVHEFAIGDQGEMREHAAMMRNMPNMKHEEGNAISLNPGETRELIWTFSKTGVFEAACNVPGHYEAGMKATLDVQ